MREQRREPEQLDLDNLPDYFDAISREYQALTSLPRGHSSNLLTSRFRDENQVAGTRAYIEAQRFIEVAIDNHQALIQLLNNYGATAWAPWSLLRPMFECAFFALWILEPTDGAERRARGLRCEVRDLKEQRTHMRLFQVLPEMAVPVEEQLARYDETEQIFREEARRLGVKWDRIHQRVNVADELLKLQAAKDLGAVASTILLTTWRVLSGYEHGLTWALMRGSELSEQTKTPGGYDVRFTINDNELTNTWKMSAFLLLGALRRFHDLHTTT